MRTDQDKPLSDFSMLELFQSEVEMQVAALTQGLLDLERDPTRAGISERLMRAAHSLKGAARLVGMREIERLAHQIEELFLAAQRGELKVTAEMTDRVLRAVDLIKQLAACGDAGPDPELRRATDAKLAVLEALHRATPSQPGTPEPEMTERVAPEPPEPAALPERGVRVNAERLTRLLGLASELVVDSHRGHQQVQTALQLKRRYAELMREIEMLREVISDAGVDDRVRNQINSARRRARDFQRQLDAYYIDADDFERRFAAIAARMHRETVLARMRPFLDGVAGFQRMVRDIARSLGKKVELKISGQSTEVDRDILDRLEGPLTHLVRNAIDHGIEAPAARLAAGKPEHGTIELSAGYSAGMLRIELQDDGAGVDFDQLRARIVARGLAAPELVQRLGTDELLEFLYLPRFSTRDEVTEFSGRGVGLDVVRNSVQALGGTLRTDTVPGRGTRFRMLLPITRSLIPALLVEIAGEAYAFPLARIDRVLRTGPQDVRHIEGRQYVVVDDENVGLVSAATLFGKPAQHDPAQSLSVVLVSDRLSRYGVVVDRVLGERVLAVQSLDPRLGKIRDIAAAAILDDGTLALVVDVDDFVRSIEHAAQTVSLQQLTRPAEIARQVVVKHVLVVDDSITVRGVETKLLESRGYRVTTAVDGMDGWNRVRDEHFDLVITDIDMPRMDGLELVQAIKADPQLRKLPVMIVSYKDRPEDRQRGLEAGADYYLTKGSFHDETLLEAVVDLIGPADSGAGT